MKFEWDEKATFEWTQSQNPLATEDSKIVTCGTSSDCKGSSMTSTPLTGAYFHGLTKSQKPEWTLLDGWADKNWWFSVGYIYDNKVGNPAYIEDLAGNEHYAKLTKLFVWTCLEGYIPDGDSCKGNFKSRTLEQNFKYRSLKFVYQIQKGEESSFNTVNIFFSIFPRLKFSV